MKMTYLKDSLLDLISFNSLTKRLYKPCDPSSLAIARILFGFLMLVDIVEERGGGDIDILWGDPKNCNFPLISSLKPMPYENMALVYGMMWIGALGIMLGFKFRSSCLMFTIPYWYIFLLDKSHWNNHSYLFGLIGVLLSGSSANHCWSLDAFFNNKLNNKHVPYWNYFVLRFQIFVLYFYAGLKKTDMEWLEGYSLPNLSMHRIFDPLKLILSLKQIDYFVIHCSGFLLDLTVGFLLIYSKTRPLGLCMCASFQAINSRLFSIGMFPYVCLATLPLFCKDDWPKTKIKQLKRLFVKGEEVEENGQRNEDCVYDDQASKWMGSSKKKIVSLMILAYCSLQGFLPYSHFITKGYNNWTNGLYGYSWDMMIHSWDTVLVVVKIVDNNTGKDHFLDPSAWTMNSKWTKHADMVVQYAECLQNNLLTELHETKSKPEYSSSITEYITSDDISIYLDVWCSMNGRFQQRMYNPNYDFLKANWSVFRPAEFLMPLLTEYNNYRTTMIKIQEHVYSWSNYSDVLFVADFPGLYLENYITDDLVNVSLTVLGGNVVYTDELNDTVVKLRENERISVPTGVFHKVETISEKPSSYMYTYTNKTQENSRETDRALGNGRKTRSPFPLIEDNGAFLESFVRMYNIISNSVLNALYGVPIKRRTRIS